jgi:hypothetical protein
LTHILIAFHLIYTSYYMPHVFWWAFRQRRSKTKVEKKNVWKKHKFSQHRSASVPLAVPNHKIMSHEIDCLLAKWRLYDFCFIVFFFLVGDDDVGRCVIYIYRASDGVPFSVSSSGYTKVVKMLNAKVNLFTLTVDGAFFSSFSRLCMCMCTLCLIWFLCQIKRFFPYMFNCVMKLFVCRLILLTRLNNWNHRSLFLCCPRGPDFIGLIKHSMRWHRLSIGRCMIYLR